MGRPRSPTLRPANGPLLSGSRPDGRAGSSSGAADRGRRHPRHASCWLSTDDTSGFPRALSGATRCSAPLGPDARSGLPAAPAFSGRWAQLQPCARCAAAADRGHRRAMMIRGAPSAAGSGAAGPHREGLSARQPADTGARTARSFFTRNDARARLREVPYDFRNGLRGDHDTAIVCTGSAAEPGPFGPGRWGVIAFGEGASAATTRARLFSPPPRDLGADSSSSHRSEGAAGSRAVEGTANPSRSLRGEWQRAPPAARC